jgi:sarcosine oxidase, subunit gamma
MRDLSAARLGALDGLAASGDATAVRPLPQAARFIFRGRPSAVEAAGRAFAVALPQSACRAATSGDRAALWLGPDEWLLLAPEMASESVRASLASGLVSEPHALVDISHRNTALEVVGPDAATLLNAGCPLDLDRDTFPVGMCARTMLGKAEIVLWRTAEQRYHVEVWRSFAAYVWNLLVEAQRELDAYARA